MTTTEKHVYLVTGGAGFIGSHLTAHLLQSGQTVVMVDNLLTGKSQNVEYLHSLNGDLRFHHLDITHYDALSAVMQGVDYVLHHAALPSVPRSVDNPIESHHHCVTGTMNVLTAAQRSGVKRVVYAGSTSAYGNDETPYKHERLLPAPLSPYAAAKLAGEYYCQVFYHTYGLETVTLRYFNVFGERQDPTSLYSAVIPRFIAAIQSGNAPVIYGDGTQTRDFTHVANIVHGNMLALHTPNVGGQVYNIATGTQMNLLELANKIAQLAGKLIQPIFEPARVGDVKDSCADINKAQRELGYAPILNFDEGLARTFTWFTES